MSGSIAVLPSQQFLDTDGQPVANGTVDTYLANTLTAATTWTDKDQTTPNTNPIVLDALGEPPNSIWLTPGLYYDFVLKDSLGATVRTYNDVTGATSTVSESSEWITTGLVATYVSATVFTVPGDQTLTFQKGRAVKTSEGVGVNKYGTVISSTFAASTSVELVMRSSSMSNALTTVDVGFLSTTNPSGLYGTGNQLILTGYAGSDITMQPGQYAVYDVSAVTSLLLRIATADNHRYRLYINNTWAAGANGAACTLSPNNTTYANAFYFMAQHNRAGVLALSDTPNNSVIQLDDGGKIWEIIADISTKTISKSAKSSYSGSNATQALSGSTHNSWKDVVTAWTSLGTLSFSVATTGRIIVERVS